MFTNRTIRPVSRSRRTRLWTPSTSSWRNGGLATSTPAKARIRSPAGPLSKPSDAAVGTSARRALESRRGVGVSGDLLTEVAHDELEFVLAAIVEDARHRLRRRRARVAEGVEHELRECACDKAEL